MLIIGGLGFFFMIACSTLGGREIVALPPKVQLPLAIDYEEDFWVDSKGNVFCFIPKYARIQIYNKDGKYLKGWFVKKKIRIYIDNNDVFNAAARDDEHIVYDLEGNIIKKEIIKGIYDKYFLLGKQKTNIDRDGFKYSFTTIPFITKIFKVSPTGERILLTKGPIYMWLLRWPLPMAIFLFFPAAIWNIMRVLEKRKRKKQKIANCSPSEKRDENGDG
jgi:hypothetical protein